MQSPVKGLTFSIPALYTPYYDYCDLSYEGDRYLYKIEQWDTWSFPAEFTEYNLSELNTTFAKGTWSTVKNSVTRTYVCNFTYVDASERARLKQFFTERNTFARGIAWSKK
jgi:hypothetical protein